MPAAQQGFTELHQSGNGMATIADTFLELRSDERRGFVDVQLQSPRESLLGKGARLCQSRYNDVLSELLFGK